MSRQTLSCDPLCDNCTGSCSQWWMESGCTGPLSRMGGFGGQGRESHRKWCAMHSVFKMTHCWGMLCLVVGSLSGGSLGS